MFLTGARHPLVVVCGGMIRRLSTFVALVALCACSQSGNSKGSPHPMDPSHSDVGGPTPTSGHRGPVTSAKPTRVATAPAKPKKQKVSLARVGIDAAAMDRSANACTNFYQFACGGWTKKTAIPRGRSEWSRIDQLARRNQRALRSILETAARTPAAASATLARLGRYYKSCTDTDAIDRAKLSGLAPLRRLIRNANDKTSLSRAIAALHRHGVWAVFSLTSLPDYKRGNGTILFFDDAGLGLPYRDYYLPGKSKYEHVRRPYRAHIEAMFKLAGRDKASARRAAADVWRVESALARKSKTHVERRTLIGLYHRYDRAGLRKLVPNLSWSAYFGRLAHPGIAEVSVTAPAFFTRFDHLLKSLPKRAWRNYLEWQLLHHTAQMLAKPFADRARKLDRLVGRAKPRLPRWQHCAAATALAMPHATAQAFVAERFPAANRQRAAKLIRAISAELGATLAANKWLHADTRAAARAKKKALAIRIGYPNRWQLETFKARADNYAANWLAARAWLIAHDLDQAGKAVDHDVWVVDPVAADATYSPLYNRLTVPAGLLMPPLFSAKHSTAVNLGRLGLIAGHELIHVIDDSGARFDAKGRMRNWWSEADNAAFRRRSQCVVDQLSRYKLPGGYVNGNLTVGETLADLGGIRLAWAAHRRLAKTAPVTYISGGFDPDQQFFIGLAQTWCGKLRKSALRRGRLMSPRLPPRLRINADLANVRAFSRAFRCKPGKPMRHKNMCRVW